MKTTFPTLGLALLLTLLTACMVDQEPAENVTKLDVRDNRPASVTPPAPQPPTEQIITAGVPAGYKMVWHDEFDGGPLPDPAKWGYQKGGYGWMAKELQNYQEADPENVRVADGILTITARKEKLDRGNYSSTRLVTNDLVELGFGYYEIRAKFPAGDGLRSSFWMVDGDIAKKGWPMAGEIDLVEHYGRVPNVVGAAVQTDNNSYAKGNQLGGTRELPTATSEFHVYSCLWTNRRLEFAVDGEVYWTYAPKAEDGLKAFPFVSKSYLAATLAVGGQRGPQGPVDDSIFPASLEIDYVRVYQP